MIRFTTTMETRYPSPTQHHHHVVEQSSPFHKQYHADETTTPPPSPFKTTFTTNETRLSSPISPKCGDKMYPPTPHQTKKQNITSLTLRALNKFVSLRNSSTVTSPVKRPSSLIFLSARSRSPHHYYLDPFLTN